VLAGALAGIGEKHRRMLAEIAERDGYLSLLDCLRDVIEAALGGRRFRPELEVVQGTGLRPPRRTL
jgi:hypothetical protein